MRTEIKTQTLEKELKNRNDGREFKIIDELPESHKQYTDKYFLRTNEILKKEGLNPPVSMKIFARGEGKIAGLEKAVEVLEKYSTIKQSGGQVWINTKDTYTNKEALMIIEAPVQSFVELETMYLGVISDAISQAVGLKRLSYEEVKEKFQRLKEIYQEIPIMYFGARHYHWSLDKDIAKAALDGGAIQTSTDIGSANIGKRGAGTTPHALTLLLASKYGRNIATRMTAELFDKYMDERIPRVTLVDTFNKELDDSLEVAKYFNGRKNSVRVDTCGENIGQGGTAYEFNNGRDPTYQTGTGVTVELIKNMKNNLIKNGYGESTEIILSSGFGDEEKAKIFMQANREFKEKTGYNLFTSVGIGESTPAKFCTADIYQIEQWPFHKVGRGAGTIDYTIMKRVI
jgi:nicotinate phosphoribosyltransferase